MGDSAHTPPGLPVVGSGPRLARDPLRFFVGIQNAYGGQYPLARLNTPVGDDITVVLDPELVHEVLADRERFGRPAADPEVQQRNGLLSSEGALWETQRSVLDPQFVGGRLAEYAEIAGQAVTEMLDEWPTRGTLDLYRELSVLTMRVISRSLFSRDPTREQAAAVHEALGTLSTAVEPGLADFVLPERLQPGPDDAVEEADAVLESVATEFVDWHRDHEDPPDDLITGLMIAQQEGADLSENELVDETVLFMTGGQETTAQTITYALYWLSRHPEIRERVRAEARRVLDGDVPGWEHLPELTVTEQVVRETLRLTPAAWNISREARAATTLRGTRVKPGELVLMPPYAHHRDRSVWGDANRFRPNRWDGEVSRGLDAYFPFGSGPRVCIGRQIALTEAQFALAHVLSQYDVEVLADELDLQPSVTLRPRGTVHAEVTALS